jgi:Bacterial protein of unknown function (DUF894).
VLSDERAGKMGWIEVAGAFTSGAVSPVHHRFAHFRQWHWMQMMAQSWVMSGLTSKAILLGLVNFAAGLPALILAPVAGSLADRWTNAKSW